MLLCLLVSLVSLAAIMGLVISTPVNKMMLFVRLLLLC